MSNWTSPQRWGLVREGRESSQYLLFIIQGRVGASHLSNGSLIWPLQERQWLGHTPQGEAQAPQYMDQSTSYRTCSHRRFPETHLFSPHVIISICLGTWKDGSLSYPKTPHGDCPKDKTFRPLLPTLKLSSWQLQPCICRDPYPASCAGGSEGSPGNCCGWS